MRLRSCPQCGCRLTRWAGQLYCINVQCPATPINDNAASVGPVRQIDGQLQLNLGARPPAPGATSATNPVERHLLVCRSTGPRAITTTTERNT